MRKLYKLDVTPKEALVTMLGRIASELSSEPHVESYTVQQVCWAGSSYEEFAIIRRNEMHPTFPGRRVLLLSLLIKKGVRVEVEHAEHASMLSNQHLKDLGKCLGTPIVGMRPLVKSA